MEPQLLIDNRGNNIEIGDRVCFNLSGEIAIGVVEQAKEGMLNSYGGIIRKSMIKVRQEYPKRGTLSEVRNPKNVMVIYEG